MVPSFIPPYSPSALRLISFLWFYKYSYWVNIINPCIYALWSLQRQKLLSSFDYFDHVRALLTFFPPFAKFNLVKDRYIIYISFPYSFSYLPFSFSFLSLFLLPPPFHPNELTATKHMDTHTHTQTHNPSTHFMCLL